MPQKRNPDCMELIRGKAGTVLGKVFLNLNFDFTFNTDIDRDSRQNTLQVYWFNYF